MEEEKPLPNSFSKSCIALIPYQTRQFKREGNHRPKARIIYHTNRLKKKITLSYAEKIFYKIQHPCMIKPLRKVGIGELPQYDKGHPQKTKKLAVNIIFNSKKLNDFP